MVPCTLILWPYFSSGCHVVCVKWGELPTLAALEQGLPSWQMQEEHA